MVTLNLNLLAKTLLILASDSISASSPETQKGPFTIRILTSSQNPQEAPAFATFFWANTLKEHFPLTMEAETSQLSLKLSKRCQIVFAFIQFENHPQLQEFFLNLKSSEREQIDFSDESTLQAFENNWTNSENPLEVFCLEPNFSAQKNEDSNIIFNLAEKILIKKFEINFSIKISEMGTEELSVRDISITREGFELNELDELRQDYELSEMSLFLDRIKDKFTEEFEIECESDEESLLDPKEDILLEEEIKDDKDSEESYSEEERMWPRNVFVFGLVGMMATVAGRAAWMLYP